MMMRTLAASLLLVLLSFSLSAQVKIGQNPESIDPASILELDDDTKALVLTRISDANMNAMTPLRGALVYNIDFGCVYYYNGQEWQNLCNAGGTTNESLVLQDNELILTDSDGGQVSVLLETITEQTFTADPIQNFRETILITQNGNNYNFEVLEITGEQIADFTIQGIDIAEESIRSNNLAPNSVGQSELSENSVGVLEIDLNQVTVSSFDNDAGYITSGAIVSPEPGNSILDNNGVYYSDAALQNQINTNTNNLTQHLAEDNDIDPTNEIVTEFRLDGNNLILSEGTNTQSVSLDGFNNAGSDDQQLTLNGNLLTLEDGGTPIDLSPFTGTGTDDQNLGPADLNGANVLTLNIENGDPVSVDLSPLAGGGADGSETIINEGTNVTITGDGTAGNPYVINSAGGGAADGSETIITEGTNVTITGNGTAGNPYVINSAGGAAADGSETIINEGTNVTITGDGTAGNPYVINSTATGGSTELADQTTIIGDGSAGNEFTIAPSLAPGQYLRTDPATGDVIWDDLPAGTGGNTVFSDGFNIVGDGQGTPLRLGDMGAGNGQVIKWNIGTGIWEPQDDRNTINILFGFQDIDDANPGLGRELFIRDGDLNEVSVSVAELQAEIGTGGGGNPTDEIQDLQLDGGTNILTITNNAGATPINLTPYLDDTNTTNATLTEDGTDLILTDSDGTEVRIALADINTGADDNTTNASLTEDGTNLILTDSDTNTVTIPLATLAAAIDTDTNTTNATLTEDGTDLILTDSDGTEVRIALADINTGADDNTTNASLTEDGTNLILTDSDTNTVTIPLATLAAAIDTDTNTTNATLTEDGTDLILTDSDGTDVRIALADISTGADTNTTNSSLTEDGTNLILTDSDTNTVTIPLATLAAAIDTDTNTTNATLTEDGTDLILTDSDGTEVRIALTDISTGADTNLALNNLTLDGNRTHDLNGNDLTFLGTGSFGIGIAPANKFHVAGAGRFEGILNSDGAADGSEPSYRFSDDTDTGIWSPAQDEIAISAGAVEAMRITELANTTKVIIQNDLELNGTLTDSNGSIGNPGDVLTRDDLTTGVIWEAPEDTNDTNFSNTEFTFSEDITHDLSSRTLTIGGTGNVVITGDAVPLTNAKLDVQGTVNTFGVRNTNGSAAGNVSYSFFDDSGTGMYKEAANPGTLDFATSSTAAMRIDATQNVGIGPAFFAATPATIDARLHVDGAIIANGNITANGEFVSETTTITDPTPDYVFQNYFDGFSELKEDYAFKSLSEIEAFVKKHKHLPGITSAAQAQEDGFWNLSKSNLQNLEKIEELFLHTIEQQKKIDNLSQENQDLKTELNSLRAEVEAIKAALRKQ